jgi:hypothetical protein
MREEQSQKPKSKTPHLDAPVLLEEKASGLPLRAREDMRYTLGSELRRDRRGGQQQTESPSHRPHDSGARRQSEGHVGIYIGTITIIGTSAGESEMRLLSDFVAII